MLINEVDAIPQRNRHNLSDSKKGRGSAQTDAATRLYTLNAFRGRLSTRNKTSKTVAATGNGGREEETKEAR